MLFSRLTRHLVILMVLLGTMISLSNWPLATTQALNPYPGSSALKPAFAPATQPAASRTAYLPLIMHNRWSDDLSIPGFGVQFAPFHEDEATLYSENVVPNLPKAQNAGFGIIRTHIYWRDIEPSNRPPAEFAWARYDQRLQDYRNHQLDPLVSIVGYPTWAMRYACGGGLKAGMDVEWRQFVRALATRYSQPPFEVHLWEIGNEVDGETEVDPAEDNERPPELGGGEPTWPFGGCWGDIAPEYVDFLRMAYEEIKAVDPDAKVTLGSLAYTGFENWFIKDFFKDFLAAGGGNYTDFIGFHWFPSFQLEWPHAVDKARTLRAIMDAYQAHKPLWLTETYVADQIRNADGLEIDRRQERYQFITQELPRALGSGEIEQIFWFSFVDWPVEWSPIDRGLVTRTNQPKPGLKVFEIMAQHVYGLPSILELPGIEGYRFRRPWDRAESWVLWSTSAEVQTISIPVPVVTARAVQIQMTDTYITTTAIPVALEVEAGMAHVSVGPIPVLVTIQEQP